MSMMHSGPVVALQQQLRQMAALEGEAAAERLARLEAAGKMGLSLKEAQRRRALYDEAYEEWKWLHGEVEDLRARIARLAMGQA